MEAKSLLLGCYDVSWRARWAVESGCLAEGHAGRANGAGAAIFGDAACIAAQFRDPFVVSGRRSEIDSGAIGTRIA